MPPKNQTIAAFLSTRLTVVAISGLALMCIAVYALTALNIRDRQLNTLAQKRELVEHLVVELQADGDTQTFRHKLDDFFSAQRELRLTIARGSDLIYESTLNSRAKKPEDLSKFIATEFMLANVLGHVEGVQGRLELDCEEDSKFLARLGITLLSCALLTSAVIAVVSVVLIRKKMGAIKQLADKMNLLSATNIVERVGNFDQPGELVPLIDDFNSLLNRLQTAYEQLEAFNASVAHELNTPIGSLVLGSELALRNAKSQDEFRDALESNLEEARRLAGIVRDMLFLSQADRGTRARRIAVTALEDVALSVADYVEAVFAERGLRLLVVGNCSGEFDVALVKRALANLLHNAARYATEGSAVTLVIQSNGDAVSLSVKNVGETISSEHLPNLFNRFYRADNSRKHSNQNHGLGLAIVHAIARMHGGHGFAVSADGDTEIGFSMRVR